MDIRRQLSTRACWTVLLLTPFTPGVSEATESIERHTPAEWMEIAKTENRQERIFEAAHPHDAAKQLGAMEYEFSLYCRVPEATTHAGNPEFQSWWTSTGFAAMRQWAADGFPQLVDRDHLIFNILALATVASTPVDHPTLFVDGIPWPDPAPLRGYLEHIKTAGADLMRRGCMGERLSRSDYELARLYAPYEYVIVGNGYLPFDLGLTSGNIDYYPEPGMKACSFTLPTLTSVLLSRDFTDAYAFDTVRAMHAEVANFLFAIMTGYEAIPLAERVSGGPVIRAKPPPEADAHSVQVDARRHHKPVMLILADPIDGYWEAVIPLLEPLYRACKDRIDWYFIGDSIVDTVYWSDYYFEPSQRPTVTFQKPLSFIERAQTAKMMLMRRVNETFPVLLDDMSLHVENAFTDGGGIAKQILIDRNGIITMNNRLHPMVLDYMQTCGEFGFGPQVASTALTIANVFSLLKNQGLWTGKPEVIPDWKPSPILDKITISAIDPVAGSLHVKGVDGIDLPFSIDQDTRIVFTPEGMATVQAMSDLKVGMPVSLMYEACKSRPGNVARLLITGATINQYITNGVWGAHQVWCPAIAKTITPTQLTASLAPRPIAELSGLNFWLSAGSAAKPINNAWVGSTVHDWAMRPTQTLTMSLDRATEVLLNGMKATIADIHPGDQLGIDFREEQTRAVRRPFFIFIYRFPVAATVPAPTP